LYIRGTLIEPFICNLQQGQLLKNGRILTNRNLYWQQITIDLKFKSRLILTIIYFKIRRKKRVVNISIAKWIVNFISHPNNFLYVKCSKIKLQKMKDNKNVIVFFTYFIHLSGYKMVYYISCFYHSACTFDFVFE
jgi:hypothetical protein